MNPFSFLHHSIKIGYTDGDMDKEHATVWLHYPKTSESSHTSGMDEDTHMCQETCQKLRSV